MNLFDAHCHLQMTQFDADREETIKRMQGAEAGGIVVGVDLATSRAALALAEQYPFLWAAVGLHPNDNPEESFDMQSFTELAQNPKVVAIGECGLDYFHSGGTDEEKTAQKKRFEQQADLAVLVQKPLIIHCRDSKTGIANTKSTHDDMLVLLSGYKKEYGDSLQAVIHFFTGAGELAEQYLALGCYLSFPGPITYTDMYDESIRVTPLDRILSETDSPFAAPVPHRGQRNEPVYVADVVAKIAAVKNMSADELKKQIVLNSQRIFGFSEKV